MNLSRRFKLTCDASLIPVLLLLALPISLQAQFAYTIENGEVTITGYTSSGGSVTIPSTIVGLPVTAIQAYAFERNESVTSVTIPNSVTSIGDAVFLWCVNLTNVTISDSVTSIGMSAFQGCTSLASVTIPNSVTSIGRRAFRSCSSLTSVTIPSSVTSIGREPFSMCTSLTSITVDSSNPSYSSLDGVLFDYDQATLLQFPAGKAASYAIPNTVTSIGLEAFEDVVSLTSITIPDSVTTIGDYAFRSCSSLVGVYFTGNAPSLDGPNVFNNSDFVTVYYLAGKAGWGATYGGRPTATWVLPEPSNIVFSTLRANQFRFNISGTGASEVTIETCTDLANPNWTVLGTITLSAGSGTFSDPDWENHSGRFYRITQPVR